MYLEFHRRIQPNICRNGDTLNNWKSLHTWDMAFCKHGVRTQPLCVLITLSKPFSPPQAIHPSSQFQAMLFNLTEFGIAIFLLREMAHLHQ